MGQAVSIDSTGEGADLYLIAGAACGPSVWRPLEPHLSGYRLHRVALAGFAGEPPVDAPLLEAAVAALGPRLAAPAVVVAHSLGCFIGYRLAALQPAVTRLVAIDGPPALGPFMWPQLHAAGRAAAAREAAARFSDVARWRRALRDAFTTMVDPAHLEPLLDDAVRSDPAVVGAAMLQAWTADLRPLLPSIRAHVHAIVPLAGIGPEVAAYRRAAYAAQLAAIPRHDISILPHAHHFAMLDAPEQVAAIIRGGEGERP